MLRKSPRLTLASRELASLRSEKTILVAIAVQLLVASFSSVLVVGVVSMYDSDGSGAATEIKFGTVGPDDEVLQDTISDREDTQLATYLSVADAYEAYHAGDIDAIMYAERGADGRLHVRLVAPAEGFKKTAAISKAQGVLQTVEAEERARLAPRLTHNPLPVPNGGDASPYAKFTYTVLLPILMFLPAFVSGSLVSDSFTEAASEGTLELLRVSPLSDTGIFDAKVMTMTALAPAQALLWSGLLYLNGTPVANIPALLVAILGITLIVTAIGAATAFYYRERSQAQFTYAIAAMAVFASFYLLPEHPINTIAKLALDNPGPLTYPTVVGFLGVGVLAYITTRRYASEWTA